MCGTQQSAIKSPSGLWNAPLRVFDDLPSTNTWLLDRGDACMHGETVRAHCQSAGRGRSGRHWMCRPGTGLTFSVAMRRSQCGLEPEFLGAVSALALAEYLERYNMEPRLKWPNDVLVGEHKIAGILSEARSDQPEIVVVGMGLNVNQTLDDFEDAGLAGMAVSMAMRIGCPLALDKVFQDILYAWQTLSDDIGRHGLSALTAGWQMRDALRGRHLTADVGGRKLEGIALGVDDRMALRVCDEQANVHILRSGEVVHIGPLSNEPRLGGAAQTHLNFGSRS